MGEQWIINLESKLEKQKLAAHTESQKEYHTGRVPRSLRELNEIGFSPRVVSFGPYHHNQNNLKLMEPYKHQALINYLNRAGKTLAKAAEAMQKIVKELMESYKGLEETWTEDMFVELMLLDGCFLLDLLIWHSVSVRPLSFLMIIKTDMVRLENQLPILVLACLIEIGGRKDQDSIELFNYFYPSVEHKKVKDVRKVGHHILDIYRKNMSLEGNYFYDSTCSIHPASELIHCGVQFIESRSKSFKDISFENGVLKLPKIDVNSHTEPLLLNMLAYEQLFNQEEAVTFYVLLMSNLIISVKDVAVLREKGIIKGMLGSDQEIANIFKRLPKPIVRELGEENQSTKPDVEESRANVNMMLNAYYSQRLNRWRASFMRSYLKNPWVFSSLLGALILLILTIFQTVYTIITYYMG